MAKLLLGSVLLSVSSGLAATHPAVKALWPAQATDTAEQKAEAPPVSLFRGVDVPVRSRDEDEITEDTRTVSFEAYYDWDFGTLTYVSETGSLAAVPSPKNWEIRSAATEDGLSALCFQKATGSAWLVTAEGGWEAIAEPSEHEVVLGDYEVLVSMDDEGGLSALRFDQMSGHSWLLDSDGWIAMPGNVDGWPQ